MAQTAGGGGGGKKKAPYKSAATQNDEKIIGIAKSIYNKAFKPSKTPASKRGTTTAKKIATTQPKMTNQPNLFGNTIGGMTAGTQGKKYVPPKAPKVYGGKGASNLGSNGSRTTNAPGLKAPTSTTPYSTGKGVANSPAYAPVKSLKPVTEVLAPKRKTGAAPYQPPSAPVVAGGSRAPQPATVNGKPVSKSNPLPAPKKNPDEYWKNFNDQAKKSIDNQNLPALNEIQRAMEEIAKRGERASKDLTERGQREQHNLEEIYLRLANYHTQLTEAQDKNYDNLRASAGGAYDKLAAGLNQNYDTAQANATAESARLGIGHTANPNAGSERDQQFLTGLAATDKAALMGGFDLAENGFDNVMAKGTMNAHSEGAMRRAMAERENNRSLDNLQFELQNELSNLNGKRVDIHSTTGQKITELARVMEEQAYAREQEAKQLAFQNQMAEKQFGLQQQQVNASLMPQAPAPPSYYEQLQAAELEQRIRANQQATDAMMSDIRAPERNLVQPIPRYLQPYPSPNAVDNYGKRR